MGSKQAGNQPMTVLVNDEQIMRELHKFKNNNYPLEDVTYRNDELNWNYILKCNMNRICNYLGNNLKQENNVVIIKLESLLNDNLVNVINDIFKLPNLPFLIIINERNEKKENFRNFIGNYSKVEKYIEVINEAEREPFYLYHRLYEITSYFYQLGDHYAFPKELIKNIKDNKGGEVEHLVPMNKPKKMGSTLNFLVIGETGTGKSSLLNAILGRQASRDGEGKPITNCIRRYQHRRYPIALYDTCGFNTQKEFTQVFQEVKKMKKNLKERSEGLHMIIFTFSCKLQRTRNFKEIYDWLKKENPHIHLNKNNPDQLPLVFVLTNAKNSQNAQLIKDELQRNFKEVCPNEEITSPMIPVELYSSEDSSPFGLNDLFKELSAMLKSNYISSDLLQKLKDLPMDKVSQIDQIHKEICESSLLMSKLCSVDELNRFYKYKSWEVIIAAAALSAAFGAISVFGQSLICDTVVKLAMVMAIGLIHGVDYNAKEARRLIGSFVLSSMSLALFEGVHSIASFIGIASGVNIIDSASCCLSTIGIGMMTINLCHIPKRSQKHKEGLIDSIQCFNEAIDSFEDLQNEYEIEHDL